VHVLDAWKRYGGSAAGRWLFGRIVCWRAPYFATIRPRFEVLEAGRCVASLADRRAVHNHIGTVHAIALCNLAELTAGVGIEASLPRSLRWIPKGMSVRYLKKASGRMRATATVPLLAPDAPAQDAVVNVVVQDPAGEAVFDAAITMWVSPRPR
jgi:acyl-coenzyme A thioesterase PaaI-like protein